MLDDCKGDKLLEVLVVFSTAVLKKIVIPRYAKDKANGRHTIALRLATSPVLSNVAQTNLVPLAMAHRSSLDTLLRQKDERKKRCTQFDGLLEQKHHQLLDRSRTYTNAPPPFFTQSEAARIKQEVRANWMGGNSWWPHTLLYGDEINSGDAPLSKPFHEIWAVVAQGGNLSADSGTLGLIENLQRRVASQKSRLRKWREFQREMAQSDNSNHPANGTPRDNGRHVFHFQRHPKLKLGREGDENSVPRAPPEIPKYQGIVAEMQQALANVSKPKRAQPIEVPKPSEPEPQQRPEAPVNHLRTLSLSNRLQRNGSEPRFAPSTTADVPLSSLFSPPKPSTNGVGPTRKIFRASTQLQLHLGSAAHETMSRNPLPVRSPPDTETPVNSGPPSDDTTLVASSQNGDDVAENIVSSVLNGPETPGRDSTAKMSLTERTRLSIFRANSHTKPELMLLRESSREADSATSLIANGPSVADRRASLLERTQQSILAANQAPVNKRLSINFNSKANKRQSINTFPINQFETPGRPRLEPRRDATPTDKLFAEDAEYDSVFKSRPKIMLSPIPTPKEDPGDELPTMSEEPEADSDIDGDSWIRSSPLRGKG
jgi:hypothetical protein